jgi:prepilin peptidase CpaA
MYGTMTAGLLIWALAIAIVDLRHRKIPNLLTLPAALAALAWMALSGRCVTGDTWAQGLWAGLFGLAVTVPAYAWGKLGAGDAKYLLAIGLLSGWSVTRDTFMIAAALGVLVALSWWAVRSTPLARTLLHPLSPLLKPLTQGMGKSSDQLYLPFGTLLSIGFCTELLNRSMK